MPDLADRPHCFYCQRSLDGRPVHRRRYALGSSVTALAVLCGGCAAGLPVGSAAEASFRNQLAQSMPHQIKGATP